MRLKSRLRPEKRLRIHAKNNQSHTSSRVKYSTLATNVLEVPHNMRRQPG